MVWKVQENQKVQKVCKVLEVVGLESSGGPKCPGLESPGSGRSVGSKRSGVREVQKVREVWEVQEVNGVQKVWVLEGLESPGWSRGPWRFGKSGKYLISGRFKDFRKFKRIQEVWKVRSVLNIWKLKEMQEIWKVRNALNIRKVKEIHEIEKVLAV